MAQNLVFLFSLIFGLSTLSSCQKKSEKLLVVTERNTQLVTEMVQVLWQSNPQASDDFRGWVHALNEGASVEGIYRAFTHSDRYRELEVSNPGSSAAAVSTFEKEISVFFKLMGEKPDFNFSDALPSPTIPPPGVEPSTEGPNAGVNVVDFSGGVSPKERKRLARIFSGASIFTLKRLLGEKALQWTAKNLAGSGWSKKKEFSKWYEAWVLRMIGDYPIDFGLPDRSRAEAGFHEKWALQASTNQIVWEILNRVHRVLNERNRRR